MNFVIHRELRLKIQVYFRRLLAVFSDCPGALIEKKIPALLDKKSVHTRASHMPTSPAPHTCDYMCHVGQDARNSKKSRWFLELEYAYVWSHSTRSGIIAYILRFYGRDINCMIHSFIYSYVLASLWIRIAADWPDATLVHMATIKPKLDIIDTNWSDT